MNLKPFQNAYNPLIESADQTLDKLSDLLDEISNDGDAMSAAREALVQAQLKFRDLTQKLRAIEAEDLEPDELAEEEDEEDEDEESA